MKRDADRRETISRDIPFDGARMSEARQRPDLPARRKRFLLDLMDEVGAMIACHVVSLMHSISSER